MDFELFIGSPFQYFISPNGHRYCLTVLCDKEDIYFVISKLVREGKRLNLSLHFSQAKRKKKKACVMLMSITSHGTFFLRRNFSN